MQRWLFLLLCLILAFTPALAARPAHLNVRTSVSWGTMVMPDDSWKWSTKDFPWGTTAFFLNNPSKRAMVIIETQNDGDYASWNPQQLLAHIKRTLPAGGNVTDFKTSPATFPMPQNSYRATYTLHLESGTFPCISYSAGCNVGFVIFSGVDTPFIRGSIEQFARSWEQVLTVREGHANSSPSPSAQLASPAPSLAAAAPGPQQSPLRALEIAAGIVLALTLSWAAGRRLLGSSPGPPG
jgi:hypothetical protein